MSTWIDHTKLLDPAIFVVVFLSRLITDVFDKTPFFFSFQQQDNIETFFTRKITKMFNEGPFMKVKD